MPRRLRRSPLATRIIAHLPSAPAILSLFLGLGIWQFVGSVSSPFVFASFTDSMAALWAITESGVLWENLRVTMEELFLGFSIAAVIGLSGGVAAALNKTFQQMTSGWVMIALATPFPAIFPILIVWYGLGIESKVALAVFAGFVPIWMSTRGGVGSVDRQLGEMTRSFGGSSWTVIRSVLLPGGLPSIMEGLRLGLGRAFIAVIVGELLAAQAGLGFLITLSGQTLRIDQLLGVVVVVALIMVGLSAFMDLVQKQLVVRWWDQPDESR